MVEGMSSMCKFLLCFKGKIIAVPILEVLDHLFTDCGVVLLIY